MQSAYALGGVYALGMLWACTFGSPADNHERFKRIRQADIGKSADDPNTAVGRLFDNRIGERTLPNGNAEIGFNHAGGKYCRYYYEVDRTTKKIVSWRFEGTEKTCWVIP